MPWEPLARKPATSGPLRLRRGRATVTVRLDRVPDRPWTVRLTEKLRDERPVVGVAFVLDDRITIRPLPSQVDDALLAVDRLIGATNVQYIAEVLRKRARAELSRA